MNNKIYILSGLGADERIFKQITFNNFEPVFLPWIQPLKNESIEEYAFRMSKQITTENPIILGVSFGGMMAIEISKHIQTKQLILLSTVKTKYELPNIYRFLGRIGILKIIPMRFLKKSNFITYYFFGAKNEDHKYLLKEILKDTNSQFLRWALNEILNWKNTIKPNNTIHIHGTDDKILPIRIVKSDISIKKGGHLMTLDKFDELNTIICNKLIAKKLMIKPFLNFKNYLKKRGYFDLVPAYLLLFISSLFPYEIDESSVENIDSYGYKTLIYGFDSAYFIILLALTVLINSLSFFKQLVLIDFLFVFLILLFILYLSIIFLLFKDIQIGFYIAFFGSIYVVVKSFKIKFKRRDKSN